MGITLLDSKTHKVEIFSIERNRSDGSINAHERLSISGKKNCLSLATQTAAGAAYAVIHDDTEKDKLTLLLINFATKRYESKSGYPMRGTDLSRTRGFFINSSNGPDFFSSALVTQSGFTYDTGLVFTSLNSRRKGALF